MAAATAPASRSSGLERADLGMPAHDRRLQVVDHLRRPRRPGHRQHLRLARLPPSRRAVLVVPGVRLGRRDAVRRVDDDDPVASADRRAGRSLRPGRGPSAVPPDRKYGTSAPIPPATSRTTDSGTSPQTRASASSVAAASALPPPRPACRGIAFLIEIDRSDGAPGRPVAVQSAAAARQTRFESSSGTPGVRHLQRERPGPGDAEERVVQRHRLEDGPELVVSIGARTEHAQIEVDLRVRPDAHAGALERCRLNGQGDPPLAAARASSASRPPARRRERRPRRAAR